MPAEEAEDKEKEDEEADEGKGHKKENGAGSGKYFRLIGHLSYLSSVILY